MSSINFPEITHAKVLVIDDDKNICRVLEHSLELPNIKLDIQSAYNGVSGLQLAKKWQPDIVILDLQMPGITGFDVLEEIRGDQQLAHTKVIMLTAKDSPKNLWEGIDRKLDDFIGKPFDLAELEARIYNQLLAMTEKGKKL